MNKTDLFMRDEETGAECWTVRPILDWTAEDCFTILKTYGIKANPLYEMGFSRVGCMPCIMSTNKQLKEVVMRFPSEIYRIEAWEKQISAINKRGASTFYYDKSGGDNKIWQKAEEAMGKMNEMFEEDLTACKSVYGLCE